MRDNKNVLAPFVLAFAWLKEWVHHFNRDITATFFDAFDYTEFSSAELVIQIDLTKKASLLEVQFAVTGYVRVCCDLTNELFDLSLNPTHELVVKFGEEFNDEDEHLLVLPHGSHQLNLAQTLFETIVLAIPQKKVHPGIENGSLQSDILDRLEELHPSESTNERETTDHRWDALKKLKKD